MVHHSRMKSLPRLGLFRILGVSLCTSGLLFSGGVDAGRSRNYFVETQYVPLHKRDSLPSWLEIQRFCSNTRDEVCDLWVHRHDVGQRFKETTQSLVQNALLDATTEVMSSNTKDSTSSSSAPNKRFFWQKAQPPKTTLMDKTAIAATVASKVATAALRIIPTGGSQKRHALADVDFASFEDSLVETTLVSRNRNENFRMLAKIKQAKKQQQHHQYQSGESRGESNIATTSLSRAQLEKLVDPLIPQAIWDRLTGREFPENMDLLEVLAKMGYRLASIDESNEWVAWSKVVSSFKEPLEEGAVHVWTGQAQLRENSPSYYGASAPFIKTRSIVPMSPAELIDLMLDSSRVKTYNQWSVGRLDLWKAPDERTKIVQNTNQVPMGKKPMRSTTLLHATPVGGSTVVVDEDTSWLLLSRAVGPQPAGNEDVGTSDILLGVNLVQPMGDGTSTLTAITHVYSAAVPGALAKGLGVKSAMKFVKDLRALAVLAQ